ncbi:MAG: DEAD-box ATP-dependent RNA helicase CshA [Candidatus Dichloromethanomonas elyunquensis]|nr:MAG: DEAD-box ATP-dependent RNA helicase CshA [Candidatus Dichloromethanomonas elyunquensis]
MSNFYELGLGDHLTKAITEMGFEETTPIQAETIPLALKGLDIIGQAQTGTGKTAAFGIPMIQRISSERDALKGLVITPTRELAIQVAEELNRIGQFKEVRALPIYGGQDIDRQIRALKNRPQIVVGTPGRLMDHMRRKTIRLQQIEVVILDEADEMLSMGFIEDIENILLGVPSERQTLLFSATMARTIQDLAQRFMKEPVFISIKTKEMTVPQIEQYYVEVQEKQKFDVLCRMLDIHSPDLAIVFSRTKRRVDELFEGLSKRGYSAEGIHGDLTQARRDVVMRHFKEGLTEILVATDVAARGLDIGGVTHVYNFDIPQDPESYVHRIGRTGRAGKGGLAVTLVTPREIGHLRLIEQVAKRRIIRKPLPTLTDAFVGQQRMTVDKILRTIEDPDIHKYKELAEELLETSDSIVLLSAALKLLTKEPNTTPVILSEESPLRIRQPRRERLEHPLRRERFDHQGFNRKRDSKYSARGPKKS